MFNGKKIARLNIQPRDADREDQRAELVPNLSVGTSAIAGC